MSTKIEVVIDDSYIRSLSEKIKYVMVENKEKTEQKIKEIKPDPEAETDIYKKRKTAAREEAADRLKQIVEERRRRRIEKRIECNNYIQKKKRLDEPIVLAGSEATAGIAWVVDKWGATRAGYSDFFLRSYFNFRFPGEGTKDYYEFLLGSTDGTFWIEDSIPLSGIEAWRDQIWADFDEIPMEDPFSGPFPPGPVWNKPIKGAETHVIVYRQMNVFILPAGGGNCVCVIRAEKAFSGTGWWYGSVYREDPIQGYFMPNWATGILPQRTVSSSGYKVYLVSKSSVKEISAPAALSTALNALFPAPQWGSETLVDYMPTYQEPFAAGLFPRLDPSVEPVPVYIADFSNPGGYTIPYTTEETVFKPLGGEYLFDGRWVSNVGDVETVYRTTYVPFGSLMGNDLYASYGFIPGYINSSSYFNYPWGASPSIFAIFNQTAATYDASSQLEEDYYNSFDYDAYVAGIGAYLADIGYQIPSAIVGFDDRNPPLSDLATAFSDWDIEDSGRDILYESETNPWKLPLVSGPAYDYGYDVNQLQLSRIGTLTFGGTRQDVISTLPYDDDWGYWIQTPMWFYDWNDPKFCEAALQQLGFSSEDLRP